MKEFQSEIEKIIKKVFPKRKFVAERNEKNSLLPNIYLIFYKKAYIAFCYSDSCKICNSFLREPDIPFNDCQKGETYFNYNDGNFFNNIEKDFETLKNFAKIYEITKS